MKTLVHRQQVKTARLKYEPKITVFTIEGYAREYGEDPVEAVEKEKRKGYSVHPSTIYIGAVLTANYPGKKEKLAAEHQAYVEAVELFDGEIVQIEGKLYTVKVMGNYSDPIHFIPV